MELSSQQLPEETREETREQTGRRRRRYTQPAVVLEMPLETRAGSVFGAPSDPTDPGSPIG